MAKARDPVCGMDVDTETAISRKIGDRTYYFCSQQCADVYTAPERELKAMQRKVTLTLLAAIAAAGLKIASAFGFLIALNALELVGQLTAYNFIIFIISIPIVFYAGFNILKGAYLSLRNHNVNMDVLVATGVLAGWSYGALAAFFHVLLQGRAILKYRLEF